MGYPGLVSLNNMGGWIINGERLYSALLDYLLLRSLALLVRRADCDVHVVAVVVVFNAAMSAAFCFC